MTKAQLLAKIHTLRAELAIKENAQWIRDNTKYVGTYWKFKNCYSCPSSENDYWWIYRKLTRIPAYRQHFLATTFQVDPNGCHRIEVDEHCSGPSNWTPCTKQEYDDAFQSLANAIAKIREATK